MLIAAHEQPEHVLADTSLLIVADDPDIRLAFQRLFETEYRLTFIETASEALSTLHWQHFDLVLLDTTTPLVNGTELLAALRAERSSAELPVILISALNDTETPVRGLQLGANDYVTKPLDAEITRARISTQIALKRAVDDRKRMLSQSKFTQEMQENFSRIVSHDLKGPLSNIRMAQFMLRDILRDNVEANSILDNMDITLNGMVEMVRMFLDAMDSQQLEPQLELLEVHDLIVETVDQYNLAAERKGIHLTICDASHTLVADSRLLRQVVGNLVSNALKFSPPGSQTCLWAEPNGENVRVCVADGGPGIPLDERSRLFTMFSKLSTRPTGGETSTGLGLWIVKELTHLQGGRVGFDQPTDGGSVFWVELPAALPGA